MTWDRSLARQLLALIVLLLAGGALVATSPASPPINTLDDRQSVSGTLTAEHPVSSVRAAFFASDEALWSDDPEVTIRVANLYFSAASAWPVSGDDGPSPAQQARPPIVRLIILDPQSGEPVEPADIGLSGATIDLNATCRTNFDCTADYDVLVEWVDPVPNVEIRVDITASWLIQVQGPEEVPVGAEVRVDLADPVARDVHVLNDNVAGTVVVDAARPLAMWSIALSANESADPANLSWPVESRAALTTSISSEGGDTAERIDSDDLAILLITEEGERTIGPFDPFEGCRAEGPCVRRMTVVVIWFAEEPERAARVDWQLNGGIVYHQDNPPAPGAEVTASIDSETVIDRRGPVLTASADGVIEIDTTRGGTTNDTALRLDLPREALAADLLGGPVPYITGTVTLEARSSRPVVGDPIAVLANFEYHPDTITGGLSRSRWSRFSTFDLNGGPFEMVVYPGTECRADGDCASTLMLETGLGAPDERLADAAVTLSWNVEITLHYPPGTDPPRDSTLRLTVIDP